MKKYYLKNKSGEVIHTIKAKAIELFAKTKKITSEELLRIYNVTD
jgi:hypothetical protein